MFLQSFRHVVLFYYYCIVSERSRRFYRNGISGIIYNNWVNYFKTINWIIEGPEETVIKLMFGHFWVETEFGVCNSTYIQVSSLALALIINECKTNVITNTR